MDRRDFLKKAALGMAAVAATSLLEHPAVAKANELINPKTDKNMKKIMIIDGGPSPKPTSKEAGASTGTKFAPNAPKWRNG